MPSSPCNVVVNMVCQYPFSSLTATGVLNPFRLRLSDIRNINLAGSKYILIQFASEKLALTAVGFPTTSN